MKQFFLLLFGFALLSGFVPVENETENNEAITCQTTNTTFNGNEKLRFDMYYNWNFAWTKVGYVDFISTETTYAGKSAYQFKAIGKTLGFYDPFFEVRDYYQSYVEKETMRPLKYVRDINEGGYTKYEELRFNYGNSTISSKTGKTKEEMDQKTFPLKNCTFDAVSILYHLRTMDLENRTVGEKIPIKLFFDEEQYDLHVKYLGKEEIKVKGQGKYYCHKVSPLLIKGDIFTETDQMKVWVTADDNKLPVLIETPIKVGSIKAVIQSAENLKYPVEAKR